MVRVPSKRPSVTLFLLAIANRVSCRCTTKESSKANEVLAEDDYNLKYTPAMALGFQHGHVVVRLEYRDPVAVGVF